MWSRPFELVDERGRRGVIRNLHEASCEIQRRWRVMPAQERAAAYRAMVVEAAGGKKGSSRDAVKLALTASGMHED